MQGLNPARLGEQGSNLLRSMSYKTYTAVHAQSHDYPRGAAGDVYCTAITIRGRLDSHRQTHVSVSCPRSREDYRFDSTTGCKPMKVIGITHERT